MGEAARVESIDALKAFKTWLWKFRASANIALADAESELQRTLTWLETEQQIYWQGQIRKRQELVMRAREAVRQKKLFKDSTGRIPSAIEEEKALAVALRRLAEAEEKLTNVKKWARRLQKEVQNYKGGVAHFAMAVDGDVPVAAANIDKMIESLEAYINLAPGADLPVIPGGDGSATEAPAVETDESASEYGHVRARTPGEAVRSSSPPGSLAGSLWKCAVVGPLDVEELQRVKRRWPTDGAPWEAPARDVKVTLAARCWEQTEVYLERATPSVGSSGWHIGAAEGEVAIAESVSVAELLAVRPDLDEFLAMPPGSLVIIDAAGIAGVFDGQGKDVWKQPPV